MSIIYTPKGRALEYAALAANLATTCVHGCRYCYVPGALRKDRSEFQDFAGERKNVLMQLEREAPNHRGQDVFLCFATDPCQPGLLETTDRAIRILNANDVGAIVLTKGHMANEIFVSLLQHERNRFCMTLTASTDEMSAQWEPKAATPATRLYLLKIAHDLGIQTGASMEPVINTTAALEMMERSMDYVDHLMVGKINHAEKLPKELFAQVKDVDWCGFRENVRGFLAQQGFDETTTPGVWGEKTFYVKKDLREAR